MYQRYLGTEVLNELVAGLAIANLPAFEKNLQKLFRLLPEDGSTVD